MAMMRMGGFTLCSWCFGVIGAILVAACGSTDGAQYVDAGDAGGLEAVACDTDQGDNFTCESIGASDEAQTFGCCMGDHLYYCNEGNLIDGDCASEENGACGVDQENGYMDCL